MNLFPKPQWQKIASPQRKPSRALVSNNIKSASLLFTRCTVDDAKEKKKVRKNGTRDSGLRNCA